MTFRITRSALTCACAALILAACDDTTSPLTATGQFGQQISLSDFETAINGTAFVEIEFATATGLVAREIDVEADDDDEKVSSRVTAINTTAGTVTLQLGGFVVSYTNNTRFRTPTNSNATRAVWEAQVQSELAAGRNPPIEARRDVPATPQAPANAAFAATDLRLTNDFDGAKIEVLVDADNLEDVASPPPLAILRVFSLPVQITAETELERFSTGGVPVGSIVEFEAQVTAVDAAAGTLTLVNGTIIKIGTATTFDTEGDLFTLATVATAVSSGKFVRAEGRGSIQSAGPPVTIAATTVKVEVDD